MSRTTTLFSNRKIFLKHVPSDLTADTPPSSATATTNSEKEPAKRPYKKIAHKASVGTSVELNREISDICDKIRDTLIRDSSKTVELKLFTPSSTDKSATIDESDLKKIASFKETLRKRLPSLQSLAGNLVKIDKQFTELGEELLRSTSRPAAKTLTDVAVLQDAVSKCPSLSTAIVEQFFLNFVILTSLLGDPKYKKVHSPLKCLSNIHRRILFIQLKVQNSNRASDTALSSYEEKFKRLLSKIQGTEHYFEILQPVEISTVFQNVQSYRVCDDPGFDVDKLKSDCLMDPKYFLYEILKVSNIK